MIYTIHTVKPTTYSETYKCDIYNTYSETYKCNIYNTYSETYKCNIYNTYSETYKCDIPIHTVKPTSVIYQYIQ